jgi:hypothetical protein
LHELCFSIESVKVLLSSLAILLLNSCHLYLSYLFVRLQYTEARVASPTTFIEAKVRVAVLPQSKINSFIRRPRVPMLSKMKALNLTASLTDMLPASCCLSGEYHYEGRLSTKTEKTCC